MSDRRPSSGWSGTPPAGSSSVPLRSNATQRTASPYPGDAVPYAGRLRRGRLGHVPGHGLKRTAEVLGWAELDHLRAGVQDGRVPGADVVGIAGLEDLLAV